MIIRGVQVRPRLSWLVAFLLFVIAGGELQRTLAMSAAHRERQDMAIRVEELNCKVDWLVATQRPTTSTALQIPLTLAPDGSGCAR